MSNFTSKQYVLQARAAVSDATYSPKKLAVIHTAIVAAISLVLSLMSYFLEAGIGSTGGLSGLGTRAFLETIRSFLQVVFTLLTPFWAMGFIAAVIRLGRRQQADPHVLTKGFHRFGPIVRMLLLQMLIYFAVVMVAVQVGSLLFAFTPWAAELNEVLNELTATGTDYTDSVYALLETVDMSSILAMMLFILIPMILLVIPVFYRLRFAQYLVMDDPKCGAFVAVVGSFKLTKGHCKDLLKIDLRYWWFYGLEILVALLAYGDLLLELAGQELTISATTASVIFYALALAGQVALYAWKKPQVFTTYALLYDDLLPKEQATL